MAIRDGGNTFYQSKHHLHFLQSLILLYGKESYTGMHRADLAGASFPIAAQNRTERFLGRICHKAGEHTMARAHAGKSASTSPPASWNEKHHPPQRPVLTVQPKGSRQVNVLALKNYPTCYRHISIYAALNMTLDTKIWDILDSV